MSDLLTVQDGVPLKDAVGRKRPPNSDDNTSNSQEKDDQLQKSLEKLNTDEIMRSDELAIINDEHVQAASGSLSKSLGLPTQQDQQGVKESIAEKDENPYIMKDDGMSFWN